LLSRTTPGIAGAAGSFGATLLRMSDTIQLETLLDSWQTSLDLHAKYAALDEARYWHVQPWPKHERPQRWIIQLARKRILALKRLVAQRTVEGDRAFIEGIEIMGFLATLVGLTSVERFIPLASPETERRDVLSAKAAPAVEPAKPPRAPAARETASRTGEHRRTAETTRQMPQLAQAKPVRRDPARPATIKPKKTTSTLTQTEHVVIADAVRLLGWGRQWHELAEMISRLAERPAPSEIRRILRTYRAQIDAVATRRKE
jgi:HPt (histidine-containing phosphotransfer) domain-containing protein